MKKSMWLLVVIVSLPLAFPTASHAVGSGCPAGWYPRWVSWGENPTSIARSIGMKWPGAGWWLMAQNRWIIGPVLSPWAVRGNTLYAKAWMCVPKYPGADDCITVWTTDGRKFVPAWNSSLSGGWCYPAEEGWLYNGPPRGINPADMAVPPPMSGYHKVRSGETLGGIAVCYGLKLKELLDLNPQIKDPDRIYIGQKLDVTH